MAMKPSDKRLEQARQYFREHHAHAQPDAEFAGRVSARLERESTELLGWAALRMLPAAIALALLLGWFALSTGPAVETDVVSPSEDLIGWLLEDSGEAR